MKINGINVTEKRVKDKLFWRFKFLGQEFLHAVENTSIDELVQRADDTIRYQTAQHLYKKYKNSKEGKYILCSPNIYKKIAMEELKKTGHPNYVYPSAFLGKAGGLKDNNVFRTDDKLVRYLQITAHQKL